MNCPEPGYIFGIVDKNIWVASIITMIYYADGLGETKELFKSKNYEICMSNLKDSPYYQMYENRFIKEDRQDVHEVLKACVLLIMGEMTNDEINAPEGNNSNNGFVPLPNNENEDEEFVFIGEKIQEYIELLLLAKNNPSATIDNLKKTYYSEKSQNRRFYLPTYRSAKELFELLAALFGTSNAVDITGLRAWYPFTKDASFDNYVYTMFTSKPALDALTVHGILKDSSFNDMCVLGTQMFFPTAYENVIEEHSSFTVQGDKISAICDFNYSFQSVFKCEGREMIYDCITGLSYFTSAKHTLMSGVLDSEKLRVLLQEPTLLEPTLFRKPELIYKDDKSMSIFEYTHSEENKYHEIEKNNIYNIRLQKRLFVALIVKEANFKLYFARANISTDTVLGHFYKEGDPKYSLWKEFNEYREAKETYGYIARYHLTEIRNDNGNTILYFKDGTSINYNGAFAYEINDEGERIKNKWIVYQHEFQIGKSYAIEVADKSKFAELENRIRTLINSPKQNYNHVYVTLDNVEVLDGEEIKPLSEFLSNNERKIIAVVQYTSQDIIKLLH